MKRSQSMERLLSALTEHMTAKEILATHISSDLAVSIISRRMELGVSQNELASRMGVSSDAVQKWENGEINFTVELLVEIAEKLDMNLDIKLWAGPKDLSRPI